MTDDSKVTIEVDGRELEATPGTMLIEVTDKAGIPIPRFCYHKKLSIAANCRMCLVEVENVPKPLPACATPVTKGMKVRTRSPAALAAQKGTMEFLLINHPLDCPICDQGGECELQDVAMGYGGDVSRFAERKRVVPDPDIGPLIATDMTRCIHCTRCVRFGAEIAGMRELGATGRGEHMTIGTYVESSVDSEMSGNVIDLCPVGALTSKPFRFTARAWELIQRPTIAPHDSVGSNLYAHIRDNRVMRVHPRENEAVNETWISDRDRFSYQGLYSQDRLQTPLIKRNGEWQPADWEEALEFTAQAIKDKTSMGADRLATLVSPNATLEELYLAQKLTRGRGSPNIDHRVRQTDFRGDGIEPAVPWLGRSIASLETLDAVLLIGSNIRKEQPILGHRLRKAALKGATVAFVNPLAFSYNFDTSQLVGSPKKMVSDLAAIAHAVGAQVKGRLKDIVSGEKPDKDHKSIADRLKAARNGAVLLGNLANAHADYAVLCGLAHAIADACGTQVGYLPPASNSIGARLAGAAPHLGPGARPVESPGTHAAGLLEDPMKAYLLIGLEPAYDFWDAAQAQKTLNQAEFVAAMTSYRSPSLEACADVLLPMSGFAETSGTLVNGEGAWQSFAGVVPPLGDSRPGWKILRVLANLLDIDGCDYISSEEVRDEAKSHCADSLSKNTLSGNPVGEVLSEAGKLIRVADIPIYAVDPLVRRAPALQATRDAKVTGMFVNPRVAEEAGLADAEQAAVVQNGSRVVLPLIIDTSVPDGCVRVAAGVPGSEDLGGLYGAVELERA